MIAVEYGRAIPGIRPPEKYGSPYAIPLSVARELIGDFEEANRDIPEVISEDQVVLMVGPELDPARPIRNYGWYVAIERIGKHRRP